MERITLFAEILLPLPIDGTFTYRIPYNLNNKVSVGQRVTVQFGKRKVYAGLIWSLHKQPPASGIPKYILSVLDEKPIINDLQIIFWKWIASYYLSTPGEVMNAALPSVYKLTSESKIALSENFSPDNVPLNESEYRITESLMNNNKLTIKEVSDLIGYQKVLPLLKTMIEKKLIFMDEELTNIYKPKKEKFIRLSSGYFSPDSLQELMQYLEKRAHKQLEALMYFLSLSGFPKQKDAPVKKTDLVKKIKSSSAIKSLLEKGVFTEEEVVVSRFVENELAEPGSFILTESQKIALTQIKTQMQKNTVTLLHGVTSSGKTELYIKLMEDALEKGTQVLYLLPEIALTTQIISRLKKHFGDEVGVYHSRYNPNERAEVWQNLAKIQDENIHKQYKIIVGPRSAMFLPFDNLGLIIVDEEHDSSYKQYDPAPRYHARDAAVYLGVIHHAKVILGSATPSIESYFNALNGKYGLVRLNERYGGVAMPEIVVVNMKEEKRRRLLKSHFSSVLLNHISKALEQKYQVILFQNRRGFSLRVECQECNWVPQCKYCDVTMTYHKKQDLLKCHYCGYSRAVPSVCENCGSPHIVMHGFGTEKVEEELATLVPKANIDRMDLDTTRSKTAFQNIFNNFETGKTNILTGTQMVTKGLDFGNVLVVGILSADNLLSYPDFRAHERSFQLMEQVSGRSGRRDKRGEVIIQTWQPGHPIIQDVVNHDFESMYSRELKERFRFKYPPYYRLIILKLKHKKPEVLNKAASVLAKDLRIRFGDLVYGPEYPMVSRIKNLFIKQIMVKIPRNKQQQEKKDLLKKALSDFHKYSDFKSVRVQIDVDPQ